MKRYVVMQFGQQLERCYDLVVGRMASSTANGMS